MLSPLVGLAELARRTVGDPAGIDPASPDGVRGLSALEDASWLVREAAGRTGDDDWPTEVSVPHPIRVIVLRAARRGFENPEGTTAENVSASGVSTSRRAEPNSVYLTADEAKQCSRFAAAPADGGIAGLGTLQMTRGENGWPATVHAPGDRPYSTPVAWLAEGDHSTGT